MAKKRKGAAWKSWRAVPLPTGMEPADYEILYDLPEGEYDRKAVGGIMTRTVRAGASLEVICYPVTKVDAGAKREARRRETTESMKRLNERNTQLHIMRLFECNFTPLDYFLTLTWEYPAEDPGMASYDRMMEDFIASGAPEYMEDAVRAWNNFIRRVKRREKALGGDPSKVKYIYVIESGKDRSEIGLPAKYHIHCAIHAPSLTDMELKALWSKGFTRCDRIDMKHDGAARLSKYLTKQKKYQRKWGRSKNLKKPVETVSYRKLSRRRAAMIADDVRQYGRDIFEAIYKGYRCVEFPEVRYSDFVAGARIYARMRLRD